MTSFATMPVVQGRAARADASGEATAASHPHLYVGIDIAESEKSSEDAKES